MFRNNIVFGIPEELDKPFVYAVCSDGFYLVKKVMGKGVVSIKVDEIPGTPKGKETIKALPRKIPYSALQTIISFFREVNIKNNASDEACALIGYSYNTDEFCIYIPTQTVSGGSAKYDMESFYKDRPGFIVVMDIHSHFRFSANFSGIDDRDDRRDRFSCVIGYLERIVPETRFRFSSMGKHFEFKLDDLFEETDERFFIDFDFNYKKITQSTLSKAVHNVNTNMFTKFKDEDDDKFFDIDFGSNYIDTYIKRSNTDRDFSLKELFPDW